MSTRMPVLFLGHGSPMNAIEDTAWRRSWSALGARLPRPRAIVCISAHWETEGIAVTAAARPPMIYDFYGFPQALFDVRYPAPGEPALAKRVAELLAPIPVHLDPARGIDHGAWSVLVALYPGAEIPVIQLSMPVDQPPAAHYAIAQRLAPLRDEGVLILGTGNVVHNLRYWRGGNPRMDAAGARFNAAVKQRIAARDHAALLDFAKLDPEAALAVPTPEHYLPLLYILALQAPDEPVTIFNDADGGAIAMTSVLIGDAAKLSPGSS